jgi:pimeloyl-ACP methyl ester carboxylesterase
MKSYYLTEIITKDNLIHQGIYFEPKKPGDTAILWVHGLTGSFYGDTKLFEKIIDAGEKQGIAFASFNNRGHDMIAGISKVDPKSPKGYTHAVGGAGYEKFEESVYDIDAGITFFVKQGYKKVILVGHSTGANKACYYAGSKKDPRVGGVILASPISDRYTSYGRKPWYIIPFIKLLINIGLGNSLLSGVNFFPITPNRASSLITPNSSEDVFDYGDIKPKLTYFKNIKNTLLVVFGEADEYADRPVVDIKKVFDSVKLPHFSCKITANATHGFDGKEKELAETIVDWIVKST